MEISIETPKKLADALPGTVFCSFTVSVTIPFWPLRGIFLEFFGPSFTVCWL